MALTDNKRRQAKYEQGNSYTVALGSTIYAGAIMTIDASGYAIPALAGQKFIGIARDYAINGEKVHAEWGQIEYFADVTAVITNIGKPVFASDDATLTFTDNDTMVGVVVDCIAGVGYSVHIEIEMDTADISQTGHKTLLPYNHNSVVQGAWTKEYSTTYTLNTRFRNTSGAVDDEIILKEYLSKGTYSIRVSSSTGASGGIITIYADSDILFVFDRYTAGSVTNVDFDGSFTILTNGLKNIRIKVTDKNVGSGGYSCDIRYISYWRTA